MSPSEFDLRAALHQGEGEPLDIDRIVTGGRARVRRRVQMMTTAAAVVVVAAAGTGIGFVVSNSDGGRTVAGRSINTGPAAPGASGNGAPNAQPNATPSSRASVGAGGAPTRNPASGAAQCPTSVPRLLGPGGGSPGQFNAGGPLFPTPVASITVCAYGATGGLTSAVLSGTDATTLVSSLEQASKTKVAGCPSGTSSAARSFAFYATSLDAVRLKVVTVTPTGCSNTVTNGTAYRYGWQPPAGLDLTGGAPHSSSPGSLVRPTPGRRQGSPPR